MNRPSLSSIMRQDDRERVTQLWDSTEAAKEASPLPRGMYIARIIDGKLVASHSGKPGYELTFQVLEGEFAGRRIWHRLWLTPAALPMTKRDLSKLGVTDVKQLDLPLRPGFRCRVQVTVRREDDGTEFNRVQFFEVVGVDQQERDPFAPVDEPGPAGDANQQAEITSPVQ